MGLVGTMVALVLGLLIASAKSFYDTQSAEITQLSATAVLLDRILVHYGPETKEARGALRSTVVRILDLTWPHGASDKTHSGPNVRSEAVLDKIQELSPTNDNQRSLKTQALGLTIQMGQARWLIFEQNTTSVPMPLLVILVFWLIVLFISFGLFVHPNVTVLISLFVSALAVSGAVLLILEMYSPYSGLIQVSSAPLRAALAQLGQ